VRDYIKPVTGMRVLDLGCGPGSLLADLGDVQYVGIDADRGYINRARRRFGGLGEFRVADATTLEDGLGEFELVVAIGLLHHVDESAARRMFSETATVLVPGGRVVTVDPTFVPSQSPFARAVIGRDRGIYVRSPDEYARLARTTLGDVRSEVRTDLLRIPYTHCVLEGTAP
jgi:SAM-dependent methyltransferase